MSRAPGHLSPAVTATGLAAAGWGAVSGLHQALRLSGTDLVVLGILSDLVLIVTIVAAGRLLTVSGPDSGPPTSSSPPTRSLRFRGFLRNERGRVVAGAVMVFWWWAALAATAYLVAPTADIGTWVRTATFTVSSSDAPTGLDVVDDLRFAVLGAIGVAFVASRWRHRTASIGDVTPSARRSARILDSPISAAAAAAAPGLALMSGPVMIMIARQHRDAFVDDAVGRWSETFDTPVYLGSAMWLWIWTLVVSAAGGVVLSVVTRLIIGARAGRGSRPGFSALLAAIAAIALLVRVAAWVRLAPTRVIGGDAVFYHVTANLIAAGRGMIDPLDWLRTGELEASAVHGPLFPWVLAVGSRAGAITWWDHRMIAFGIGTTTVVLVGLLGRRLAGPRLGLLGALLAAAYPNLWLIDAQLYPEGLFAALITALVILILIWRDRPRSPIAIAIGAVLGLATLTRGEALVLAVILVTPWILRHRGIPARERIRQVLVVAVACGVVLAPWTLRNLSSFDEFVLVSTNSDEVWVYAHCEDTYRGELLGYWLYECQDRIRRAQGDPPGDESVRARAWRRIGLEYASDHLDRVPVVLAARVARQWELYRPIQNARLTGFEGRHQGAAVVGVATYGVMMAVGVVGLVTWRRRRIPLAPVGAVAAMVTLTAIYAYGNVRFRAPFEPLLCLLAAQGLLTMLSGVGVISDGDGRGEKDSGADPSGSGARDPMVHGPAPHRGEEVRP